MVHTALPYACNDKLTLEQTHTLLIHELTQFKLYFPSCQTNYKYLIAFKNKFSTNYYYLLNTELKGKINYNIRDNSEC